MIIKQGSEVTQEITNVNPQTINENSFYYGDIFQYDISQIMIYFLDIEIEHYFRNVLNFPLDRIIYASNDSSFRERTKKNGGELNIPFINYYQIGYSDTDREWFNHFANSYYPFGSEKIVTALDTTFRIVPTKLEYEATVYFSQHKDAQFAYKQLLMESSNETRIFYNLPIGNIDTIQNIGILSFDLEFNPTYNESDWLEMNNIHTIACDFSIDTFLIMDNKERTKFTKSYSRETYTVPTIATNILLNFMAEKGNNINAENALIETIRYFNGE